VIPRIIPADEWRRLEAGLRQRGEDVETCFLHDIYHEAEIVRAGRIPAEAVFRQRPVTDLR